MQVPEGSDLCNKLLRLGTRFVTAVVAGIETPRIRAQNP